MSNNPFLQPLMPDPFEEQKRNQEASREIEIEFQRLHYEIFMMSPEGKKLYSMLHHRFVVPSKVDPREPSASTMALWWDGFRAAIRGLHEQAEQHSMRVKSGGKR